MLTRPVRWTLTVVGPLLWIGAGLMPTFGGAAKHAYRCRGHEYADRCFNDYLPIAEIVVFLLALITAYLFFRFSRRMFVPPQAEGSGYRSTAIIPLPTWHLAVAGALWCGWRLLTYPLVPEMLPYLGFWTAFGMWFAVAAVTARSEERASVR